MMVNFKEMAHPVTHYNLQLITNTVRLQLIKTFNMIYLICSPLHRHTDTPKHTQNRIIC